MSRSGLRDVVERRQTNAVIGWLLVGFLTLVAGAGLFTGDLLWAGFTIVVAALVVVPAVVSRDPLAMLPWEVVALASLPMLARVLITGQRVGGITLTGRVTTYLAVAAVALIIAVELDVFTPVKMNYSFAVLFVVIATMAAAGVWAVAQWLSDIYLGTAFFAERVGETTTAETRLMWDFVAATAAGLGAGLLFEFYFRRQRDREAALVEEVQT
ncbi:hypothetical protein SAMN04487949_1650 [Halogranum gelatinilyticum]|uniref:Uncharacterized protein n=1 Tax=Halogranum gelatinilyticum TaxID=660521 RepID=A0A1G9T7C5_9EURY|nr:hypothetical protein [Halogranum gelatinilyticum]SDM43574.1 hypothetical protein SAMN04487949_1650 [Halogranum gelatinilyticum]